MQRTDEHRAAEPEPFGARRRVTHELDRTEMRPGAHHLLEGPRALEAERLGSREVGAQSHRLELAVDGVLGNGDSPSDRPTL